MKLRKSRADALPEGQQGRTGESPGNAARVVPLGREGAGLHPSCTVAPSAAAEHEEASSSMRRRSCLPWSSLLLPAAVGERMGRGKGAGAAR